MTSTTPRAPGRVLVAVDGSPSSLEALRQGQRSASLLGDQLVAVHAWACGHRTTGDDDDDAGDDDEQQAAHLLESSIRIAFSADIAPMLERLTVAGDAAETLIRLSQDAVLLVVGSRGHGDLDGKNLGSVSNACVTGAHCPVLTVYLSS